MFAGQYLLGSGSSFLWASGSRTFLVTNWHNLSGINPITNVIMSKTGTTPDRIVIRLYKQVSEADLQGFYELKYEAVGIGLFDEAAHRPRWLEHPEFGRRVDIAALDVTHDIEGFQNAHANSLEDDAVLDVVASQDVFIVGFPFGLIVGAPAPIWKRGSLALDPTFDVDGLPKMLVDTATREGMSGSVVVVRHIIVGKDYLKKDGTRSRPVLYARKDCILGVYSGRYYPDLDRAQLGIVWKRRAIEETISGNTWANV
jgi:hypothetical protein